MADDGSEIAATTSEELVIRANPAGLRSLTYHLLALAQPGVPLERLRCARALLGTVEEFDVCRSGDEGVPAPSAGPGGPPQPAPPPTKRPVP